MSPFRIILRFLRFSIISENILESFEAPELIIMATGNANLFYMTIMALNPI